LKNILDKSENRKNLKLIENKNITTENNFQKKLNIRVLIEEF